MTTILCSTAAELRSAIEGGAVSGDQVIATAGSYSFTTPVTLATNNVKIRGVDPNTLISSSADPIFQVNADDSLWERFVLNGTIAAPNATTQVGFNSTSGKRATLRRCMLHNLSKGVKVDTTANNWMVEYCHFHIWGTADSYGYGFLSGSAGGHYIFRNQFIGYSTASKGRHGVYMSAGTSDCEVVENYFEGYAEESIAMYALGAQPTCKNNRIFRNVIRDQAIGSTGTGAIGINGLCQDIHIQGNKIYNAGRQGIMINTIGLISPSRAVIENNTIHICGDNGIMIQGASECRIINNLITGFGQTSTSRAGIEFQAWWQSSPTLPSSNNLVSRNTIIRGAAAHWVNENQTAPVPTNNTVESNNTFM